MSIVVAKNKRRGDVGGKRRLAYAASLAAILLLAILVVKNFRKPAPADAPTETPPAPVSVAPRAPAPQPVSATIPDSAHAVAEEPETPEPSAPEEVALPQTEEPTEEPKPRRRAGARVVDKDGNDVFKPRPELKTKTDKFLFAILHRPLGAGRVTLTTYRIEEDFLEALKAPVEIMPDDTEEDMAIKQEIEGWKEYLKEQMDAGQPLVPLLEDIRDQINLAAEEHAFARRELYKMVKAGEMEEAVSYLDAVNAKFEKEGVLPLHIPAKLFDRGMEKYESRAEFAQ